MAGDWIKMRTALANDPAVIAIALDLDKSEFEVVGMLHHLWSWADSQSQDGHIKRVTDVWIDRYVHHKGFAKSMCDAGWLIIEKDGITFPNFDRHNGESAKKRAEATERQRISRANRGSSHVTDTSHQSRDKSVTREEKRREENKATPIVPTEAFAAFWSSYPKKTGKGAAEKAWLKVNPDLITLTAITQALESAKSSIEWRRDAGKYIPNPATWLNQKRWEDQYTQAEQLPYCEIVQAYNSETAGRLQPCTGITAEREQAIRLMYEMEIDGKQLFRANGVELFAAYFSRCAADEWMAGGNQQKTPVSIDYVLREQVVHKVMGAWKSERA